MLISARDFYLVFAAAVLLSPLILMLLTRNNVMSRFWGIAAAMGVGFALLTTLIQWGGSSFWHTYPG